MTLVFESKVLLVVCLFPKHIVSSLIKRFNQKATNDIDNNTKEMNDTRPTLVGQERFFIVIWAGVHSPRPARNGKRLLRRLGGR